MKYEEQIQKNIDLSFEFLKYLIDNPDALDQIPDNASIVFMPDDDPELCAANQNLMM